MSYGSQCSFQDSLVSKADAKLACMCTSWLVEPTQSLGLYHRPTTQLLTIQAAMSMSHWDAVCGWYRQAQKIWLWTLVLRQGLLDSVWCWGSLWWDSVHFFIILSSMFGIFSVPWDEMSLQDGWWKETLGCQANIYKTPCPIRPQGRSYRICVMLGVSLWLTSY